MRTVLPLSLICLAAAAYTPRSASQRRQAGTAKVVGRRAPAPPPRLGSLRAGATGAAQSAKRTLTSYRTPLLFCALIVQKVAADTLTGYTRSRGAAYSGATVSMLSEVAKFPVLLAAVCAFGGGARRVVPTMRGAVRDQPLSMAWIAGAYALQNVLYFVALGHVSAASYQVLSQSKMVFTAMLAVVMLRERLGRRKIAALAALLSGSLLVQMAEMSTAAATAASGSGVTPDALYGGFVTVLGALLSALPNVWYEKLLKTKGQDEWVRNFQVTSWIFAWIAASQIAEALRAPGGFGAVFRSGPGGLLTALLGGGLGGITPLVWLVIGLKALNGVLIPATLKYAGNLVYLYAKPTSIVLTALATAIYSRKLPPKEFVLGAGLVIWSMLAFSAKPAKAEDAKE